MENQENDQNPVTKYPQPPFPEQQQTPPASNELLRPKADHGEESYKGNGRLKGKRAIITGGDSGIGRAIAIAFAREGANVLISYLGDEEDVDAQETAGFITAAGQRAVLVKGDIRSQKHCLSLVEKAVSEFGGLDILVNNAAFQMGREGLGDLSAEEWQKTFDTNITAIFYLCKAAEPHLRPGSSIINTTSVNAYSPSEQLLAYAATKGAIQNFTANLSQILLKQGKGIRVNAVAPGPIWTPLIPSTIDDYQEFGTQTPMGRPGQPVELSPVYVLLASDEASYISGATIPVTGGMITI